MNKNSVRNSGSTLVISLITITIIGLTMASYLSLVSSQNRSTMRSLEWNSALAVAEAGVEEALTHLYHNPDSRNTEGWVANANGFTKERSLGENKYVVTISTSASSPVITSLAYVRAPLSTEFILPPRAVRVTTTNEGLFARGMVAKGAIDLNGNNIRTDSFDSTDPLYSTLGRYDATKAKDGGSVATNSGLTNSFNVGNADIHGSVASGQGGYPTFGPNGGVGPKEWLDAGNTGIYDGWFRDDMNVDFPDVQAPFSGGAYAPASGSYLGTNYTYLLTSGNYEMSSLSMSSKNQMLVLGNAVLYVKGDVSISGQASIILGPNGSLRLYVAGANADLSGGGVVNTGSATNFFYFGLPSNTSLKLSGNAGMTGVVYAPNAALTLAGGGSTDYNFSGATVSASVRMDGHFNFHYDESLADNDLRRGLIVNSWNEIGPGEIGWTP